PRRTALFLGAMLIFASVVSHPGLLRFLFPFPAVKDEFTRDPKAVGAGRAATVFSGQLVLALAVAVLAFFLNRKNLLGYIDGQYVLTLAKNQAEFMGMGWSVSTNPLQGLGDPWYFVNTHWLPELSLAHVISDAGWQRVAVQSLALLEL